MKIIKGSPEKDYFLAEMIGEGYYGKVHKAVNLETNKVYAIKTEETTQLISVVSELYVYSRFDHPNIMKAHAVYIQTTIKEGRASYKFHYVMELGTPMDKLIKKGLSSPLKKKYLKSMVEAYAFLEKNGIIYGDIKTENVIISDEGEAMIADFGLYNIADCDNQGVSQTYMDIGAQYAYNREIAFTEYEDQIQGEIVYNTTSSAMWALGMTIILMYIDYEDLQDMYPMRGDLEGFIYEATYRPRKFFSKFIFSRLGAYKPLVIRLMGMERRPKSFAEVLEDDVFKFGMDRRPAPEGKINIVRRPHLSSMQSYVVVDFLNNMVNTYGPDSRAFGPWTEPATSLGMEIFHRYVTDIIYKEHKSSVNNRDPVKLLETSMVFFVVCMNLSHEFLFENSRFELIEGLLGDRLPLAIDLSVELIIEMEGQILMPVPYYMSAFAGGSSDKSLKKEALMEMISDMFLYKEKSEEIIEITRAL